jgi:hypothetical protein
MIERAFYMSDNLSNQIAAICVTYSDGKLVGIPLDPANTDYQNIMKLVEDGELIIAPAEEAE